MAALTFENARAAVREHLSARSAEHSDAVAQEAARIAARYGVDEEAARLAGVLHDWARDEDAETLFAQASESGIEIGAVDRSVPYLLHAAVGAVQLAREFPGIDVEVLSAVARHTTGAADMSELDQVVYVADMIEPHRSFDGVEELRAAVGAVPLDELFARAYEASLRHLIDRKRRLHPETVEVWNGIVAGGRS